MVTINLNKEELGGRLVWTSPTQAKCGSCPIPWEEIQLIASVVNIRILEGAEIPPFIYSSKGGRDGFPKVRVFDESGGEIKNIPIRSWTSLDEDDPGEASERESIAPSFTPRREGEVRLDPSAPPQNNPESPNDEFELTGEEPYRVYFARGKNLIVLKEGRLEDEEEPCVLVCASNKFLYHGAGVAGALRERAGPKFQEESYKIMQRRKSPVKTGDVLLQKIGGPNGKPVMHAIGHEKGQRSDIEEELTAMLTLDETSPEELEKALIRYDRKTEIIQTDREKSNNKPSRPKDQPRRSEREKKPYNRFEPEGRPSARSDRRPEQKWKRVEERAEKNDPKFRTQKERRFRDQSKPRTFRNESERGKSSYISPDKWEKMSAEDKERVIAERGRNKPPNKIGRVRVESPNGDKAKESKEIEEVRVKRKRGQKKLVNP
ncbi:hypothetical protein G5714_014717 [Onychostoma macrolepis]|uniref:Macro domain-containing protein n=1 Tax=Onychostoma macrolepis TaxID=369639 RepID=A0A7J6C8Z0_9TELE|nr:hypothetical protein G5714_014717 [Onychostoma macrolepis]